MKNIDRIALSNGLSPEAISLSIVKKNRPAIERYIIKNGGNPHENPAILAAQACLIHENKIYHKQRMGTPDYFTAEDAVLAEEAVAAEFDGGEADDFSPAILGTVFKAGKKAIAKINEKRKAKGKKPILSGQRFKNLTEKIKKHVEIDTGENGATIKLKNINTAPPPSINEQSDLAIIKDAVIDQATEDAKADWMKKNLPIIIAAGIVAYLIFKK